MRPQACILYGINADPPHLGHLEVIKALLTYFPKALVVVMPAGQHPFDKPQRASFNDRFTMTELLVSGLNQVIVDDFESKTTGKSYTLNSLRDLKNRYADLPLYLALSTDAASHFFTWHEPEKILRLARPILIRRPPYEMDEKVLDQFKTLSRPILLENPMPNISSSQIRQDLKEKKVPIETSDAVLDYIIQHQLYQNE